MRTASGPEMREQRRTILVVDDDPDVRDAVADCLEDEGFRTLRASNGSEALALLRGDDTADLILLDLMMPVMNGWEFREQQLRDEALAGIPVVVMTAGRYGPEDRVPATAVLRKPLELDRLIDVVGELAR